MPILCSQWVPEVWNMWTSQMLNFLPWDGLPGLYSSHLAACFVGLSVFIFVSSKWKASSIDIGRPASLSVLDLARCCDEFILCQWIKFKSQHFNRILIVSSQSHHWCVQRQNHPICHCLNTHVADYVVYWLTYIQMSGKLMETRWKKTHFVGVPF